jgi:hypothetical protein
MGRTRYEILRLGEAGFPVRQREQAVTMMTYDELVELAGLWSLANYTAGGFATTAGGNGGALVSGTPHTEHQSLFTHPRA